MIAISSSIARKLGLTKRRDLHLVDFSIRRGRWNHHIVYLTRKNTFAVPTDAKQLRGGQRVETRTRFRWRSSFTSGASRCRPRTRCLSSTPTFSAPAHFAVT